MVPFNFRKWDTILGWAAFFIAFITYSLTVEPTMSFWDCGEYIATAAKLEVGHPPGAPLFQMLGAFFATFAFGNNQLVALMVNMMSVLSSAFTILFMFWSSTMLLRKVVSQFSEVNKDNSIVILGSAFVGSLAFAYTDSFWFNAVEAEVYAMASLFIALLFWLGLRWEQDMDSPRGNRWLLVISLVVGLSFGVHFMALLTIPSIGLLYYFKHYKTITPKNFIIANVVIVSILLFIFKLLLPWTMAFFGKMEIYFVNNFDPITNSAIIMSTMAIFITVIVSEKWLIKKFKDQNIFTRVLSVLGTFVVFAFVLRFLFRLLKTVIPGFITTPFNKGTIFALLLVIAIFYFILRYTRQKGHAHLNTMSLCLLFILIGFSTWMMLPIRANANTPINENRPSDAAEVLAYYNREQYGVNPLFYGPQYTDMFAGLDKETPYLDKKPNYERDYTTGKYVITNNWENAEQNTDDAHKAILPRLWSTEHAENYMNFTHVPNFTINHNFDYIDELGKYGVDPNKLTEEELAGAVQQLQGEVEKTVSEFRRAYAAHQIDTEGYVQFLKQYGDYLIIEKPTTVDNLSFMFEYQFGYMFWRYLMWNFTGRQNDIQGKYDNLDGNWLSGIGFIDKIHLGSQDNLPDDVANNKGRNVYFFLPFILGILGMAFHANKDLKSFYVLLVLFLFTGLALKIYLNERPFEPRERDYALVGSFYVFAIWIGIGVYSIYDYIKKFLQPKTAGILAIAATFLAAPVLMASQNWDDHDRSGKYTAIAMAKNYLNSCDKNAILFTIGDNDTFPLWYAQEIEGVRPDVKIVCTSLLMTDWYTDQMKNKTYEAEGLPISFKHEQYVGDKLDFVAHQPLFDSIISLNELLRFIKSDDERTLLKLGNGQSIHFYPTDRVRIPVDKDAVIRYKQVAPKDYDSIVPYIDIKITGSGLYKNRLMMLDFLANNNWKRPIYFTGGSFGDEDYLWMKDYLQLDGMVYKLVPVRTKVAKDASPLDMGKIDTEKMYNIVTKFDWGNGESTKIYHDPETRKNSITYRTNLSRLMDQLIAEGQMDKAKNIINIAMTKMPVDQYGYYTMVEPFASGYYKVGEKQKARQLLDQLMKKYQQNLEFYKGMDISDQAHIAMDIQIDIERYRGLLIVMKERGDLEYYNKNKTIFNKYNKMFERFHRENE
jgi:hypothetical protein